MVSIPEFCDRLIGNATNYFRKKNSLKLLTQSKASCKAIIKSCIDAEPDCVLEIGTNYGLSTLSLAYALKVLGKPMYEITTVDVDHSHWIKETPEIQKGLLLNAGIAMPDVKTITGDFSKLDPKSCARPRKMFAFYDIHDTVSQSYMAIFLRDWLPRIESGIVMVHDFCLEGSDYWLDRDNPVYPTSRAVHASGRAYEGYAECKVLIDYLNSFGIDVEDYPGTMLVSFRTR
jgi:hypothetical protein